MIDENNQNTENTNTEASTEVSLDEQINKAVEERLAGIKDKLDGAYQARDEAIKLAEAEKKARQEAEIKSLEEQGKTAEAEAERNKQLKSELEDLRKQNIALTRDTQIKEILAGHDFSGEKAARMAAEDIRDMLKRKDDGSWVGNNGESISDVVNSYVQDEANAFLFKAKISQGSGSMPNGQRTAAADPNTNKQLSPEMNIFDVAQGLREGTIELPESGHTWR